MKSIWIVINNIVNKGTKRLDYPDNLQMQNTIISDIKQIANDLNDFYSLWVLAWLKFITFGSHIYSTILTINNIFNVIECYCVAIETFMQN